MSHYVCELSSIKYENIYMPEEGKMSAVCVCFFFPKEGQCSSYTQLQLHAQLSSSRESGVLAVHNTVTTMESHTESYHSFQSAQSDRVSLHT